MKKYKKNKRQLEEAIQGYIFLIPAAIIIFIFIILSIIFALYLTFNKVNLITHNYEWNHFKNYLNILKDTQLLRAISNTAFFSVVVVPAQTIISLIMAYTLINKDIQFKKVFRLIYFLPTLTSSAALTLIFMFVFNQNGPVNSFLLNLHMIDSPINFINDPDWTLKVIMIMNVWSTVPYFMTIYLASLVDLPASLYEAAEIDGANALEKLRYITIPYLRPISTYVILSGIIGTFQMFDQSYIFSGGTGGPSNSTLTVSLLIYQYAFGQNNQMGYAAVLAITLAMIIFIVTRIAEKLNGGNGLDK